MGILLGIGFLAIALFLGLIATFIAAFIGHIILLDSILLALTGGITCHILWKVHPAFCLLIGIALFFFLFWLQNTKYGFWIIGTLLSLFWAFVFGFFAYGFSNGDMIWFYVIMGLGFVISIGLHLKARNDDLSNL